MVTKQVEFINKTGLHARPASDFCKTAGKFKSHISVIKDGEEYDAKSILLVLCIGAEKGDTIEIKADGEDERAAVDALIKTLDMG